MSLKKIPCYIYQNGTQKDTANINLRIDNDFVSRFTTYTTRTKIYSWTGIHETNLRVLINEYLKYSLLVDDVVYYVGIDGGFRMPEYCNVLLDVLRVNNKYITGVNRSDYQSAFPNITYKTLNNCVHDGDLGYIRGTMSEQTLTPEIIYAYNPSINDNYMLQVYNGYFQIYQTVYEDNLFDEDKIINRQCMGARFEIFGNIQNGEVINCDLYVTYQSNDAGNLYNQYNPKLNLNDAQDSDTDPDNPYDDDGGEGGEGDGTDPNGTDPVEVPGLPSVGASDFITIYGPSASTLNSLAGFLWSADNIFNIDNFKKLYSDPSEALIGLNVCPCIPNATGTKSIKFGNIDTDVSCQYFTTQWCEVNCGTVSIETTKSVTFMDYSPYVKIQLFLPYIGFQMLDADEVMGRSIGVVYHVDVVSGDVVAFVRVSGRGVMYSYSGNCLCTIPITGSSYGQFWNKYYSSLANVVPAMGGGAMMGGAAGAAMGGLNTLFNAAETVMLDQKPQYQKSGTMSGAAGIMGVQRPFVIIERPNISVPEFVSKYAGLSANKTMSLGSCSGYTQVDYVHLDGINATTEEIREIETLLHGGVIL